MAKEIASVNLDGSALQRVLSVAAAGGDVGDILEEMAGDEDFGDEDFGDEDFGDEDFGDEDFGADDLSAVLNAAMAGEYDDFSGDDAKALQQLLAAAAGDEDFGAEEESIMRGLIDAAAGAAGVHRKAVSRAARKVMNASRRQAAKKAAPQRKTSPMARPAARKNSSPAPSRGAQTVTRKIPGGGQAMVTKDFARVLDRQNPGEGPHTPLPLTGSSGQAILANNTAQVTVRPPKDYILTGMHLQGENAERCVIDSITIEGDPLFALAGSIPGGSFHPLSNKTNLPRRMCKGGRDIVLTLRNISAADITVFGVLWGDEGDASERASRT